MKEQIEPQCDYDREGAERKRDEKNRDGGRIFPPLKPGSSAGLFS
jgi:hypothetical protein